MSEKYVPVDCAFHDRLEDAAVRRRSCRISYLEEDGAEREVTTRILDVWTQGEEEFAKLETGAVVRLDRLLRVEPGLRSPHGAGSSGGAEDA
ncbi:MAG: hypothetical protein OEO23_03880 [Gemmatimonadota bacterium]|nr:hypothetical protein [Gemmatimonadota bacterium]